MGGRDVNDDLGGLAEPLLDTDQSSPVSEYAEMMEDTAQRDDTPTELVTDLETDTTVGGFVDSDHARLVPSAHESSQITQVAVAASSDGNILPPWFLGVWNRRNEETRPPPFVSAVKVVYLFILIVLVLAGTKSYDWRHYRDWLPNYGYGPEDSSNLPPAVVRDERILHCAAILSAGWSHFNGTDTPQMQAVNWLIAGGGRHVVVPVMAEACLPGSDFATLYALMVLKGALGITNAIVPFWGDIEVEVNGVEDVCHGKRNWHRIGCETTGKSVTALNLANATLNGSIPPEIRLLTSLNRIELYGNPGLRGQIPPELADLSNLEYVKLHDTSLDGPVPTSLGRLSKLRELFVEKTLLTGIMPAEICRLRTPQHGVSGALKQLHADCGGEKPRIACQCCECYEAPMENMLQ